MQMFDPRLPRPTLLPKMMRLTARHPEPGRDLAASRLDRGLIAARPSSVLVQESGGHGDGPA
jgi:hypothetical protein